MDAAAELQDAGEREVRIVFRGSWQMTKSRPRSAELQARLSRKPQVQHVRLETADLQRWDSSLLAVAAALQRFCTTRGITFDATALPAGIRELLAMAADTRPSAARPLEERPASIPQRLAQSIMETLAEAREMLRFTGETCLAAVRVLRGRGRLHLADVAAVMQQCGPEALPIVTLISILVGLILAYISAVQLQRFGATIYVANLVGLGMLREMGALMAAVIMAGRTGAAFAAQLGTMQVNEEIDALKTLGISPMEYLVLPRLTALVLMMPLLCLYADFLGIIGGSLVGVLALHINYQLFIAQTKHAIAMPDLWVGLCKSFVFGVLIAVGGCLRGMQASRSASAVGDAVTSAVVTSIIAIVIADAVFAIVTSILKV